MRKITDSWCYEESIEWYHVTLYTRGIQVKEGKDLYQGNIKGISQGRKSKRTNLIEYTIYDTKPVQYISMVSEELKWVVKNKECFNVDTGKI